MYRRSFLLLFPAAALAWFGIDKVQLRKELMVAHYIRTPEGREMLAQSMLQPIRRNLHHTRIARRSLGVSQTIE
jgi:hypothetical protein